MQILLVLFFQSVSCIHFNGGTIRWSPVDPYDNSSTNVITITQTCSWNYPTIKCDQNVPITTPGRINSNDNLTCVVDCKTDGGYSKHPIDILTNCTSTSSSLEMMTSEKSVNITLNASAHFSIAYQGAAWRKLDSPGGSGLDWSILCSIDLRKRDDGLINTPPKSSIVSPQYVIVNQPSQIKIPVSDDNLGDDVRCRWSTFTRGYRRKRFDNFDEYIDKQIKHSRGKRGSKDCNDRDCKNQCSKDCKCYCSVCQGTNCYSGGKDNCDTKPFCPTVPTTTRSTRATTRKSTVLTTSEATGTKRSTSVYPTRQAIDECAGICYPSSVPSGTTLSNCAINFTGLVAGAWYAIAVQVEDFINSTSNKSMSSIPVQFLIHVLPTPTCSLLPVFQPYTDCLEAQIDVSISFDLYVQNLCDPDDSEISDIIISLPIDGLQRSSFITIGGGSYAVATFTWTPQLDQIGLQQFCTIAFTSEYVQSEEYCTTFNVQTGPACTTTSTTSTTTTATTSTTSTTATTTTSTTSTTTTTTSTTTTTTTTTTSTTTTTTTTTTSTTTTTTTTTSTTTTTTTTTTSTTTTTTTTTTSTTTTTTTTTSTTTTTTTTTTSTTTTTTTTTTSTTTTTTTTTSTTTTTTTTTSTTTTTTTTTTSTTTTTTTTTSTTTTTTTTTSTTTTTTTTTTSVTTVTRTTTKSPPKKGIHWLTTLGLSLLFLLLAICCSCCFLYYFLWSPSARRRRKRKANNDAQQIMQYQLLNLDSTDSSAMSRREFGEIKSQMVPENSNNIHSSVVVTRVKMKRNNQLVLMPSPNSSSTLVVTDEDTNKTDDLHISSAKANFNNKVTVTRVNRKQT